MSHLPPPLKRTRVIVAPIDSPKNQTTKEQSLANAAPSTQKEKEDKNPIDAKSDSGKSSAAANSLKSAEIKSSPSQRTERTPHSPFPGGNFTAALLGKSATQERDADALYRRARDFEHARAWGMAYKYFEQAAEKGHRIAQFDLGYALTKGENIVLNMEKGLSWIRKSAAQGHVYAIDYLGSYYLQEGNLPEALSSFLKAAEKDFGLSKCNAGILLMEGKGGITKNVEEAFKLFEQGAKPKSDHFICQYLLAVCYRDGIGTAKNADLELLWFKKMEDHKSLTFRHLAKFYINVDLEKAEFYFEAFKKETSSAHPRLGEIAEKISIAKEQQQKAKKIFPDAYALLIKSLQKETAEQKVKSDPETPVDDENAKQKKDITKEEGAEQTQEADEEKDEELAAIALSLSQQPEVDKTGVLMSLQQEGTESIQPVESPQPPTQHIQPPLP